MSEEVDGYEGPPATFRPANANWTNYEGCPRTASADGGVKHECLCEQLLGRCGSTELGSARYRDPLHLAALLRIFSEDVTSNSSVRSQRGAACSAHAHRHHRRERQIAQVGLRPSLRLSARRGAPKHLRRRQVGWRAPSRAADRG